MLLKKASACRPARNYRISGADILNRSCAFDADLESILLGDPPQNPFSTASTQSGHRPALRSCRRTPGSVLSRFCRPHAVRQAHQKLFGEAGDVVLGNKPVLIDLTQLIARQYSRSRTQNFMPRALVDACLSGKALVGRQKQWTESYRKD